MRGLLSAGFIGLMCLINAANAAGSEEEKITGESAALLPVSFTDIGASLAGVVLSDVEWGDYDSDGDLDLVLLGLDALDISITKIYRNDTGTFVDIGAGLTGVFDGDADWGDYDGDGDLDLAVTGSLTTTIYQNNSGTFSSIGAGLIALELGSSVAWGDYDNDGDPDLALLGRDSNTNIVSKIYRNDSGIFSDTGADIVNLEDGTIAWGDYDNDGDLDLIAAGRNASNVAETKLYKNQEGVFTETSHSFAGVIFGHIAWGDYDSDGDLDLGLTGRDENGAGTTKIYRNDSGSFSEISTSLPQLGNGSHVAWGDFDTDGDLDLALSGDNDGSTVRYNQIYENDGGTFIDILAGLTELAGSSMAWGDYDNDGDLDLLSAGVDPSGNEVTKIYRNDSGIVNAAPSVPQNPVSTTGQGSAILSWTAATDTETPDGALSYNLRIGTNTGAQDIKPAHANLANGFRKIIATGNAGQRTSWTIKGLAPGTYYWSVQAVDGAKKGGGFSTEQTFTIADTPVELLSNIFPNLLAVTSGEAVWGDYDRDEDLDVAMVGLDASGSQSARVFRNDSGSFFDIGAGLPGVDDASTAWGDYDGDGDLDLALSGDPLITNIYENSGGIFTDIGAGLRPVDRSSMEWGDMDNDGDLDLAVMGFDGSQHVLVIFENTDSGFQELDLGQPGLVFGEVSWGDYDVDGDLDLAAVGLDVDDVPQTMILQNQGPGTDVFTNVASGLTGIWSGTTEWGDYDNDGDLDLVVTGSSTSSSQTVNPVSIIYRNDSGQFTDIGASISNLVSGDASWGDMDNDGDLDLAIMGFDASGTIATKIYENVSGGFLDTGYTIEGLWDGRLDWGDYDSDGDLDLLINGQNSLGTKFSTVYQNQLNASSVFTSHSLSGSSPAQSDIVRSNEPIILNFNSILDPLSLSDGLSVSGTSSGNVTYGYTLTGNNTTLKLSPSPGYFSSETISVTLRTGINGLKNLYGQWFDSGSNGIADGVPADDLVFSFDVAQLADLNFDQLVDFNDLTLLRDAWVHDDFSKEMGPVDGAFPTLRVIPDSLFDVEDLITFIRYWNDAFAKSATQSIASASKITKSSTQRARQLKSQTKSDLKYVDFVLKTATDPYQPANGQNASQWVEYDLMVNYPDNLLGMEVILEYDPVSLHLRQIKNNKLFEQTKGGQTIFLSHVDSLNGIAIINTANFGRLGKTGNKSLATFRFELREGAVGEFSLGYDIRNQANASEKGWSDIAANIELQVPKQFSLEQNYPNPFNPQTTIRYQIAEKSNVRILVYNVLGRKVATLIDKEIDPGFYRLQWNAAQHLASGVYLYVLDVKSGTGAKYRKVKKMLLIK